MDMHIRQLESEYRRLARENSDRLTVINLGESDKEELGFIKKRHKLMSDYLDTLKSQIDYLKIKKESD